MPRLNKKTERYSNGTIRPDKNGKFNASIYLAGERRRARFSDLASAQIWLDAQSCEYQTLDKATMLDASRALALLPKDITLLDVAKFYLESKKKSDCDITLVEALSKWLESKRKSLRPSTYTWYQNITQSLIMRIGNRVKLSDVSTSLLEDVMSAKKPSVRNAYIRVLMAFYSWAVKCKYASQNPLEGVSKSVVCNPKRNVLTIDQVKDLLSLCVDKYPHAVPYYVLGLFAGLRPFETLRISRGNIQNGFLYLGADITKTLSERTVPVRHNLEQWLRCYPIPDCGLSDIGSISLDWVSRTLFKTIGVKDRKDVLRHSFASYAYEMTGDASLVAAELGHTTTNMLFRHYRGLVPPKSGSEYFSITPDSIAHALSKKRT